MKLVAESFRPKASPVMEFTQRLRNKAAELNKTIVLPEAQDERMLQAAGRIRDEGIARIILLGNADDITGRLAAQNIDAKDLTLIDPALSTYHADFSRAYFELRKHKGMTTEEAAKVKKRYLEFIDQI